MFTAWGHMGQSTLKLHVWLGCVLFLILRQFFTSVSVLSSNAQTPLVELCAEKHGSVTLIKYLDKPQTVSKLQKNICWVFFWLATFLWEKTKFNAAFLLMDWYALCNTIFGGVTRGVTLIHSFVPSQFSLDKCEILQPIWTDLAL